MLCESHCGAESDEHWRLAASRLPYCTLIAAALILAALPGARPAAALQLSEPTVRLEGGVSDQRAGRILNARVRVESEEGDEVFETGVNDQGRYAFSELRRAVYHLIATADGYETARQTVDLTRSPSHSIVDIMMTPLRTDAGATELPSLTDTQAPRSARKEYEQGMKALAANRVPEAKAHFAKAVTEYPCYARAQTAQALGMVSDRNLGGAEAALRKAVDCDAGFTSAYLKLGELYNAELRFQESRRILEDGARREPGSWKFHYHLGVAYDGLGAYPQAEAEYLRSESLTPPAPADVHVKLADLYSKQKLYEKAYTQMQAYLDADPHGRFADKVRNVMGEMKALVAAHPAAPATPAAEPAAKP
jgi:tetratricopeptide (TPR) repeat protein